MNLLSGFRSLFRRASGRGTPALPAGRRIYAVGDIHGFPDRLDDLLGRIERDLAGALPKRAEIVFLGDYIDHGPGSAAVIDRLARHDAPCPIVTLRGNHEAMMLDALSDPNAMETWCGAGGDATLRSYGVDPAKPGRRKGWAKARAALLERLPDRHRAFLDGTLLHHTVGSFTFVHAGLRPGVPLERQSPEDLLWIRKEFFGAADSFEGVVVHGHTPCRRPENEPHRINVDTGVFKYGMLTCAVLEGTERRFLSTRD
jgi:serine/threonine protein phosphatase 1